MSAHRTGVLSSHYQARAPAVAPADTISTPQQGVASYESIERTQVHRCKGPLNQLQRTSDGRKGRTADVYRWEYTAPSSTRKPHRRLQRVQVDGERGRDAQVHVRPRLQRHPVHALLQPPGVLLDPTQHAVAGACAIEHQSVSPLPRSLLLTAGEHIINGYKSAVVANSVYALGAPFP
jgi:hypothetical protein